MKEVNGKPVAPFLGNGVYLLSDVARYTGLHYSRVRSWFHQKSRRGTVFASDYRRVGNTYSVSFHDLIDVVVAGEFRAYGVPLRVVRAAYRTLQKQLGVRHPFCHEKLYHDGKRIFVSLQDGIQDEILQDAITRQQLFSNITARLEHVEYGGATKLAERWRIARGVVIDPRIQLGNPVVESTGISTRVLASFYRANHENADLVADLYDLSPDAVLDAVTFESQIRAAA